MSVLIKGGRIVTAADDYVGDVFVENGTVSLIGDSLDVAADKVVDAAGKLVIPGAIDPHTHIEMFFGGTTTCDDFTSGTVSAAFGGTTTLVDFCMQAPGTTFQQALENYHEKIDRCKPVIDVGFHIGVTDLREGGTLEDLAKLPDEGITSYKLFMAYKGAVMVDDETLFKAMETAAESGAMIMVHAENGDAIDIIVKRAVAEGKKEPIGTRGRGRWRPRPRRRTAPSSSPGSPARRSTSSTCPASRRSSRSSSPQKGWNVHGETCTQYLFVDESALDQPGFEGGKYIYTPPPRPKEHQEQLWHALGSDVSPSSTATPVQVARAEGINGRSSRSCRRRPGHQEPPAHALTLRRPPGPHLAEPVRGADLDERGKLSGSTRARARSRRARTRHRRMGSREAADDLRLLPPLERQLRPLRGHQGAVAPKVVSCAAK